MYVVYSSLQATYACNGGSVQTIGASFERKTIGYSSRFLAYGTLSSPDQRCDENVVVGGFHTIDFADLYYHPITTTVTSKAGCPPYVNPRLSMPAELTDVDPAWGTCQPLYYGAFDPPRVLTRAGGFDPIVVHSKPRPTPKSTKSPTLTINQETTPVALAATQGPQGPTIPTATSKFIASTPAEQHEMPSQPASSVISDSSSDSAVIDPVANSGSIQASPVPSAIFDGQSSRTAPTAGLPQLNPIDDPARTTVPLAAVPVLTLPSTFAWSTQHTAADPVVIPHSGHELSPGGQTPTSDVQAEQFPSLNTDVHGDGAPALIAVPETRPTEHTGSGGSGSSQGGDTPDEPYGGLPGSSEGNDEAGQDADINLADHILFGLSGQRPTGQDAGSGIVSEAGGLASNDAHAIITLSEGASRRHSAVHFAVMQTPTPLAVGTHAVALASNGAIVVASQTILPGQQATVADTIISAGNKNLIIGSTTHELPQQTGLPLVGTTNTLPSFDDHHQTPSRIVFSAIIQEQTLQPGETATINNQLTTHKASTPIVFSQTSSIPISTISNPQPEVSEVSYTASILVNSIAPGAVFTLSGTLITNTASRTITISQTSQIPFSNIGNPQIESHSVMYTPSLIVTEVAAGVAFTLSGTLTTNTASTPIEISRTTSTPVSTINVAPIAVATTIHTRSLVTTRVPPDAGFILSGHETMNTDSSAILVTEFTFVPISTITSSGKQQLFVVNGQLVTETDGVYALSEIGTVSRGQGQRVTLAIQDPTNGSMTTTVVTLPTGLASQLHLNGAGSGNRNGSLVLGHGTDMQTSSTKTTASNSMVPARESSATLTSSNPTASLSSGAASHKAIFRIKAMAILIMVVLVNL